MKVHTKTSPQEALSVQQRFGLGCISGAAAHAVFYPLEVSEITSRFEYLIVTLPLPVLYQKCPQIVQCYVLEENILLVTLYH